MADADTTSDILLRAGFADVVAAPLRPADPHRPRRRRGDRAGDGLGPAGEILRLAGDRAAHLHGEVDAALREGLAEFDGPDGVRAPASTWIVTATVPVEAAA